MNKTKLWRYLRLALAALGLSTLMADGGLREDEIDCEQAVAHLQECCPGFARTETLQCEYNDGCGTIDPALSIDQSLCILGESCAQIVSSGLCDRARNLPSPSSPEFPLGSGGAGSGNGTSPVLVCP